MSEERRHVWVPIPPGTMDECRNCHAWRDRYPGQRGPQGGRVWAYTRGRARIVQTAEAKAPPCGKKWEGE